MQIHELDNFSGALGAGAFLAVDNGIDTGKVSTQQLLSNTESEIETLDTTLNARIDNIIAGGTAPSAAEVTDARLGANNLTYASLGEAIRGQISSLGLGKITLNANTGHYVGNNGQVYTLASGAYSDPFPLKKNQKLFFQGKGTNGAVALISIITDITQTPYVPVVLDNGTTTVEIVSYTATEDCFAIVSTINTGAFTAWTVYDSEAVYNELLNFEKSSLITSPTAFTETGKYISYSNGAIYSFGSLKYATVFVKGAKSLNYYYTFATPDTRGLAFYDENDTYISGVQTLAVEQENIPIPQNAVKCRATIKELDQLVVIAELSEILRIMSENGATYPDVLSAFKNITCIGDSLTESLVYTGASTFRQAYKPYPTILGAKTGVTMASLARGGYTALQAWNAFNGDIVNKDGQLFIIFLGTNDGLTDTLATDAPTSIPYQNWAATNTGSYAKLIAKAQDVGGRVLLLKCFASSGDKATTNNVIDQCAARFNCAVLDEIYLRDAKYHYYPDLSGQNGAHYNDLGYSAFVDVLMESVGKLDTDQMKLLIPA